ncbi:MAG: hypothetical protein AAB606_01745 [Patescibacteria group bacterium]
MSQLILTRSSQYHRALRTGATYPFSLRVGKFFLFFSMTLMIGVLSFFYLVKSTEIHTKGYQLRRFELEHDKLVTSREIQTMGIAEARSLSSVRQSDIVQHMVPARAAVFITQDGSVAQLPKSGSL